MFRQPGRRHVTGVTLIEMIITVLVLVIILVFAVPSYRDLNERRALQGVANGIISAVALAKEEAIKRDQVVRVQFADFGKGVCVGASTAAAPCDCSTAGSCPLAAFPSATKELRMVETKSIPEFNGSGMGFSIDPKTGMLTDPTNIGGVELQTSLGYAVRVQVNAMVRPRMCASGKDMPGVRKCP